MEYDNKSKPIAICQNNEVEAWEFPFFVRPATDIEPAFIFLEDHLYNLDHDLGGILEGMFRVDSEDDLRQNGFFPAEDGIFYI